MLSNTELLSRYGVTKEEWDKMTNGQKSNLHKKYNLRRLDLTCECGNPATVIRQREKICQRCADIESRFDKGGHEQPAGYPGITVEYSFKHRSI